MLCVSNVSWKSIPCGLESDHPTLELSFRMSWQSALDREFGLGNQIVQNFQSCTLIWVAGDGHTSRMKLLFQVAILPSLVMSIPRH
jgi:hypothetical protein